jgi:hypothetical protein
MGGGGLVGLTILERCEVEGLVLPNISGCNEAVDCAAGVDDCCAAAAPLVEGVAGCDGLAVA